MRYVHFLSRSGAWKLLLVWLWLGSTAVAQPLDLPVFSTPQGVFLQLPNSSFAYQQLIVERALPGRKNWKRIGTLGPVGEAQLLEEQYAIFQPYFPQQLTRPDTVLWQAWTYMRARRPLDQQAFFRQPAMQLAMGFAWLDETAAPGRSYRYRLRRAEERVALAAAETSFSPNQLDHTPLRPLEASRDEPHPRAVWLTRPGEGIADFRVFRCLPGGEAFEPIWPLRQMGANGDSLQLSMTDTTAPGPGVYAYYIQPLDMLGNQGQASPPQRAGNLSRASLPTAHQFRARTADTQRAVRLSWRLTHAGRVQSLGLYRSRHHARDFVRITELPPGDTVYLDPVEEAREGYYYYLAIHDLAGYPHRSATIFGVYDGPQAVAAPTDLAAQRRSGGIALNWAGPPDFVRGYYVYRAEGYRGPLRQISAFLPASEGARFVDTASLRDGQIYTYAVRAESDSYQPGPFSERVVVHPDSATVEGPSAPLRLRVRWTGLGVSLIWEDLAARGALLRGYQIWRKTGSEEAFRPLADTLVPGTQNFAVDSQVRPGQIYTYAVSAHGVWGGQSPLSRAATLPIPAPTALSRLGLRRRPQQVDLSWQYPETVGFAGSFRLYRTTRGSRQLMARLPLSARSFADRRVVPDRRYLYQLELVDADGHTLSVTDPVPIRF